MDELLVNNKNKNKNKNEIHNNNNNNKQFNRTIERISNGRRDYEGSMVSFKGVALVDTWHWSRFLDLGKTEAVIINSGAWFSPFFGFNIGSGSVAGSGDDVFEKTLWMNAPIIAHLIKNESIPVFWVCLPPVDERRREWDWHRFKYRNQVAKKVLTPLGVTFIDFWKGLHERYLYDPTATVDLLHWRGPAYLSVPHFLNRFIFHSLAINSSKKKRM